MTALDLQGKSAVVLGTKRSGRAATELLLREGAQVRVLSSESPSEEDRQFFAHLGVTLSEQSLEALASSGRLDILVPSPAVPWDLPLLEYARQKGIAVMGEVELASYFLSGPVVGITGSNGKTTTTALTGHIFQHCGLTSQVGGNIGVAVTALVETSRPEQWNVLELSSFQLEGTQHFKADIGVCLNVTPDHLDRHYTFENYAAAKGRLFATQDTRSQAILNWDDPTCRQFAEQTLGAVHWFSTSGPLPQGFWLEGDALVADGEIFFHRNESQLRGLHNVENILAASLTAKLAGVELSGIAEAIRSFPGVEHRIEFVRELHGVRYYNDSKATNVDAALKAIAAFDGPLWLIAGGKDKGSDYRPLAHALKTKARGVLLIGAPLPYPYAAAPLIKEALGSDVPVRDCESLEAAAAYAAKQGKPGDTVLLAPACASFDQFANYEERGKRFKQIVRGLV
jgi:UDP-N-acetylmuramoylalanine--D-glutamate ligase